MTHFLPENSASFISFTGVSLRVLLQTRNLLPGYPNLWQILCTHHRHLKTLLTGLLFTHIQVTFSEIPIFIIASPLCGVSLFYLQRWSSFLRGQLIPRLQFLSPSKHKNLVGIICLFQQCQTSCTRHVWRILNWEALGWRSPKPCKFTCHCWSIILKGCTSGGCTEGTPPEQEEHEKVIH